MGVSDGLSTPRRLFSVICIRSMELTGSANGDMIQEILQFARLLACLSESPSQLRATTLVYKMGYWEERFSPTSRLGCS